MSHSSGTGKLKTELLLGSLSDNHDTVYSIREDLYPLIVEVSKGNCSNSSAKPFNVRFKKYALEVLPLILLLQELYL